MAFACLVATSNRRMHVQITRQGPSGPVAVSRIGTERGHVQTPAEMNLLRRLADVINAGVDLAEFDDNRPASTSRPTAPICEECNEEMNPYTDPSTGNDGFGCDLCGWSEDVTV